MTALAETLLVANPIWFMRKRDLAIAAGLLLVAVAAFVLFALSWVRASRREGRGRGPTPPPAPPRSPRPPEEVSKTRGVR